MLSNACILCRQKSLGIQNYIIVKIKTYVGDLIYNNIHEYEQKLTLDYLLSIVAWKGVTSLITLRPSRLKKTLIEVLE